MKICILKKDSKTGFYYLAGINRAILPGQVTKLSKSVSLMGCIRPIVVAKIKFLTGKEETYIIDGQHLINALIRNNMDIPYVFIEVKDKRDLVEKIALLNSSSKSWTMFDYVTAWSSISDEYKKLNNFYNVYDFELGVLSSILSGSGVVSGGNTSTVIKSGQFKVINEKENVDVLNKLTDVLKIVPRMNRIENRYLCTEYIYFLRNKGAKYNHSIFLKNLEVKKKEFILVTQESGVLAKMFEKLC
jgi:hypothetical protein